VEKENTTGENSNLSKVGWDIIKIVVLVLLLIVQVGYQFLIILLSRLQTFILSETLLEASIPSTPESIELIQKDNYPSIVTIVTKIVLSIPLPQSPSTPYFVEHNITKFLERFED
jgi:hypothetical protein